MILPVLFAHWSSILLISYYLYTLNVPCTYVYVVFNKTKGQLERKWTPAAVEIVML